MIKSDLHMRPRPDRQSPVDKVAASRDGAQLQERVVRRQAPFGERAERKGFRITETGAAADGIVHAHKQITQLV